MTDVLSLHGGTLRTFTVAYIVEQGYAIAVAAATPEDAERIRACYGREADVVHPPVEVDRRREIEAKEFSRARRPSVRGVTLWRNP